MGVGKGGLQLISATEEVITMEDEKGPFMVIDCKSPDEPNKGWATKYA